MNLEQELKHRMFIKTVEEYGVEVWLEDSGRTVMFMLMIAEAFNRGFFAKRH